MPNLLSNLIECLGFSQTMKSTLFKILIDLKEMSSKFPIGVDTIYKPGCRAFILILFTIIISCSPENFIINKKIPATRDIENPEKPDLKKEPKTNSKKISLFEDIRMLETVEVLLPNIENQKLSKDFINALELSIYKKNIKNLKLNINLYSDKKELEKIIEKTAIPGKIFIGPLTSSDLQSVKTHCSKKVLFFSFSSKKEQAGECIYLINFFPEDDIIALFNNFEPNSKVALLYPENNYGYYINSIIDPIATESKSIIVNRASYKSDLSNAREAIKELSSYDLRKYELERQKKILKLKNDEVSRKALKKIEKFETVGVVDFTHLLLPEYSIRLLQIAPLIPFYDIDPEKVQFVGTGVWDNKVFFDEPSLQGAIFPGVLQNKREEFMNDFFVNYKNKPPRTITIPYDLVGLISYIINNNYLLSDVYFLLNESNTTFSGIDGKFNFKNNIIFRELQILRIEKGKAKLAN